MTSSEGRDPIFQNTQLGAPWELSINNSSKKCCAGTRFHYLFFSPITDFWQHVFIPCLISKGGSPLPGAPMKTIDSCRLTLPLPILVQVGTPD